MSQSIPCVLRWPGARVTFASTAWSMRTICITCEVDHIISLKHGGASTLENLAYACFHCNRHKGTDIGSLSLQGGVLIRFFNPRTDPWGQHFFHNSGRIESLTEIAEVTSRLLDFNHPERVALRKLLAEIGRYPSIEALARMR